MLVERIGERQPAEPVPDSLDALFTEAEIEPPARAVQAFRRPGQ